jgi:starvation-inducible DNA-binding protein
VRSNAAPTGTDQGTNDLLMSDVIRRNELQVWFVAAHVVDEPLVHRITGSEISRGAA